VPLSSVEKLPGGSESPASMPGGVVGRMTTVYGSELPGRTSVLVFRLPLYVARLEAECSSLNAVRDEQMRTVTSLTRDRELSLVTGARCHSPVETRALDARGESERP
jgi:hypothetical protein